MVARKDPESNFELQIGKVYALLVGVDAAEQPVFGVALYEGIEENKGLHPFKHRLITRSPGSQRSIVIYRVRDGFKFVNEKIPYQNSNGETAEAEGAILPEPLNGKMFHSDIYISEMDGEAYGISTEKREGLELLLEENGL